MNVCRHSRGYGPWIAFGLAIGVGVTLAGAACVLLLPSAVGLVSGGYSTTELLTSTSPDGRHRVVVSTRLTFPATELLDPEAVVSINLFDVDARRGVDAVQMIVMEESDVGKPSAEWKGREVRVSGIERWHNVTAVLCADRWTEGNTCTGFLERGAPDATVTFPGPSKRFT